MTPADRSPATLLRAATTLEQRALALRALGRVAVHVAATAPEDIAEDLRELASCAARDAAANPRDTSATHDAWIVCCASWRAHGWEPPTWLEPVGAALKEKTFF